MKLTDLQYGVLIQALHNAQELQCDGDFIDPHAENDEGYTDEDIAKALNEVEDIVAKLWVPTNHFDFNKSTEAELLKHVGHLEMQGATSLQFTRGGYFYDLDEHSEGGYYYDRYDSLRDYDNGVDSNDGGLCTTTLTNAVEMALN